MNDFDSSFIYNDDFIEEDDLFHPSDDFDFQMSDTPPERIIIAPSAAGTPRARIFVSIPNNFVDNENSNTAPTNSKNEIKSEPIKFELSENQTNVEDNATQTSKIESLPDDNPNLITARPKTGSKCFRCSDCLFATIYEERLDEHRRIAHSGHNKVLKKTQKCPACDNEFFARKSLVTHLELDHDMPPNEIQSLIDERHFSVPKDTEQVESRGKRIYIKNVDVLREPETIVPNMEETSPSTSEFRLSDSFQNDIFIDLVNSDNPEAVVLPSFEELQNDVFQDAVIDVDYSENKFPLPTLNTEKRKPKIYIKNVDILKEPLLVPPIDTLPRSRILNVDDDIFSFDENSETADANVENIFANSHQDLPNVNETVVEREPEHAEIQHKRPNTIHLRTVDELNLMNMEDVHELQSNVCNETIQQDSSHFDSPYDVQITPSTTKAQPKIYIKNVDILKEHIVVPSLTTKFLNMNDNLEPFSCSDDQSGVCEPQSTLDQIYLVDSNPVSNDMPMPNTHEESKQPTTIHLRTVEELNSMNVLPSLQENPTSNSYLQDASNVFNMTSTTVSEPPMQPKRKPKIYIKNVDILKEPILVAPLSSQTRILNANDNIFSQNDDDGQVQSKRSNTIHLRTVDELNLLNMTEVNNLLASLPDGSSSEHNKNQMTVIPSSENSKSSDDVRLLNTSTPLSNSTINYVNFNAGDLNFLTTNYNNFQGSENAPESPEPQSEIGSFSAYFDLSSQQPIFLDKSDHDLLEAYAQNLIDDSQGLSPEKVENNASREELRIGDIVEFKDDVKHTATKQILQATVQAKEQSVEEQHTPEKGRIYVANNLMADGSDNLQEEGKSAVGCRGRERGSRKLGITKLKKVNPGVTYEELGFVRCDLNCAYKFRDPKNLEYHKKCHTSSPDKMQCIECNENDFTSWNTLHTHLWRRHKIDMELYSCDQCSFKTPILSRLINTHSKLHSNERNFKCNDCDMAFKNARQLKDHRPKHRISANQATWPCPNCKLSFASQKTLNVHVKNKHTDRSNEVIDSQTRYQCDKCEYIAKDHNAFRKHKMTHDNEYKYKCPFCDFGCIQSTVYQRHIRQKHPDRSSEIILQCSQCRFSTINPRYYDVHMVKHKNSAASDANNASCDINLQEAPTNSVSLSTQSSPPSYPGAATVYQRANLTQTSQPTSANIDNNNLDILNCDVDNRQKIKVKSVSVLTDPSKFCTNISIPNYVDVYKVL